MGFSPWPSAGGAGVVEHPGYVSGNWYLPGNRTPAAGTAMAPNVARFIPFIPLKDITISALGVRITTVGNSNFQLAVYNNQQKAGEGPRPSTEVGHSANVVNTAGNPVPAALSATMVAGTLYWLAINNGDTGTVMVCTAASSVSGLYGDMVGTPTQGSLFSGTPSTIAAVTTPLTFGTWGDLTSATWTELVSQAYALIALKAA